MIKLIQSTQFDPEVGVGMEIVDTGNFVKSAEKKENETIFGKSYDELKPDKNHVGIHVVAMGDEEHYGPNRNADSAPADSLRKYHDTFVSNGHVFRHHRNKDPKKAIGDIVASAFNEPMGRVELFIHADKDKAAPELERLERDGEIPFSMAMMTPWDECSICGQHRTGPTDPKQCVHISQQLGEVSEDGKKVFMRNIDFTFFDISFVGKPADRIAWDLMKVMPDEDDDKEDGKDDEDDKDEDKDTKKRSKKDDEDDEDDDNEKDASYTLPFDSVKLAEYYGVEAPDSVAINTKSALRKLAYARSLVGMHDKYTGFITKSASADSSRDRFLYTLCKIATHPLKDSTIEKLRSYDPQVAFRVLGDAGVVMDSTSFYKYAMGKDFSAVKPYLNAVPAKTAEIFKEAENTSSYQKLCNDTCFDALPYGKALPIESRKLHEIKEELKEASAIDSLEDSILSATIKGVSPNFVVDNKNLKVLNNAISKKLAEKYAAYKLSAIDAVVTSRCGETSNNKNKANKIAECVVALSTLQDMQEAK